MHFPEGFFGGWYLCILLSNLFCDPTNFLVLNFWSPLCILATNTLSNWFCYWFSLLYGSFEMSCSVFLSIPEAIYYAIEVFFPWKVTLRYMSWIFCLFFPVANSEFQVVYSSIWHIFKGFFRLRTTVFHFIILTPE